MNFVTYFGKINRTARRIARLLADEDLSSFTEVAKVLSISRTTLGKYRKLILESGYCVADFATLNSKQMQEAFEQQANRCPATQTARPPFQKDLEIQAPGENRPSRHNLMPNRARIGHARASSGDKPDARKNRPTLRRRGFLHKIAPSLMEAATHRADNSDEARYRLLLNDVVE